MNNPPKAGSKTIKRLLAYVFNEHRGTFVIVLLCIVVSALAGVAGSLFLQILVDDYITPLIKGQFTDVRRIIEGNSDYGWHLSHRHRGQSRIQLADGQYFAGYTQENSR